MGWESSDVRLDLEPLLQGQMITMGLLALVSCISGGYRFASVLQCVGLVLLLSTLQ